MDVILYKLRPYICLAFAAYALIAGNLTPIIASCTVVLLFCSLYIFALRSKRRHTLHGEPNRSPNARDLNRPRTYNIN